ncbi:U4/U6.U5 snRNP associated protein [Spiromyces aspiralis]|uniref:U4/U6.U5 snRNP associated protein n=1 Tax=Spiromyces aspiralis TaxID=68401 RepID=A0ACC1HEL7_9FUNG|nr:U4/U6.U5 snRNP associated protein [Spiromyces aspiralis]
MSERKSAYGANAQAVSFRKTWDREEYEKRAKERERLEWEQQEDEERRQKGLPPKKRHRYEPVPERGLLQARTTKVNLAGMLGKTQVVQASSVASRQPGFYCRVCDCTVKDSVAYLDHINGKKHQRNLEMSMRVKRDTIDDVKSKLEALKKRKEQPQKEYDFDERVEAIQKELDDEKRKRRQRKKERKRGESEAQAEEGEDGTGNSADPDITAMMGQVFLGRGRALPTNYY